jgi:RNA polymerase sigma factor (sigma-70 family)
MRNPISRGRGSARLTSVSTLPPFEHVVEQHGQAVLRFCAAQAGADRAEDCFQETMLAALRGYRELRDPAAIRSWLFSIAARKAIDAHRARIRLPEPVADPEPTATVDGVPVPDGAIWREVRALPPKQREAVALRYLADLSHAEIAVVMQTSADAARRNVFEGLRRLRAQVEVEPHTPTPPRVL